MTFDERGRIWVTESLEYPRHSPGPGRDVIKVLESTKGDGHFDKITTFADGLNIPSGIAVGHGGVWVANSPDILFMQDTTGSGKADKTRSRRHRIRPRRHARSAEQSDLGPRRLSLRPQRRVQRSPYSAERQGFSLHLRLYRINPRTREFSLFCEGTSNPWGLAWDPGRKRVRQRVRDRSSVASDRNRLLPSPGRALSAVHLGTRSIVDFHHQKAAYCGLQYLDSDAFPRAISRQARDGQHPRQLPECRRAAPQRFDVPGHGRPRLADGQRRLVHAGRRSGSVPTAASISSIGTTDITAIKMRAAIRPASIGNTAGIYRLRYKNTPPAGRFRSVERDRRATRSRGCTAGISISARRPSECWPSETKRRIRRLGRCWKNWCSTTRRRTKPACTPCGHWSAAARSIAEFHGQLLSNEDPSLRAWGVRAAGNFHQVDARVDAKNRQPGSRSIARREAASRDRRRQARRRRPGGRVAGRVGPCRRRSADPGDRLAESAIREWKIMPTKSFIESPRAMPCGNRRPCGDAAAIGRPNPRPEKPDVGPIATLAELMIKADHSDNATAARILGRLGAENANARTCGPGIERLASEAAADVGADAGRRSEQPAEARRGFAAGLDGEPRRDRVESGSADVGLDEPARRSARSNRSEHC